MMAEGVSLDTIARQIEQALAGLDAVEGRLAEFTGMAEHCNETLTALAGQVRGLAQSVNRADQPSQWR